MERNRLWRPLATSSLSWTGHRDTCEHRWKRALGSDTATTAEITGVYWFGKTSSEMSCPCRSCPCPHKALNASNPGATQLSISPFMAQTQFLPAAEGESRVPDLSMSQNHLRGLVKAQTAGPQPQSF